MVLIDADLGSVLRPTNLRQTTSIAADPSRQCLSSEGQPGNT